MSRTDLVRLRVNKLADLYPGEPIVSSCFGEEITQTCIYLGVNEALNARVFRQVIELGAESKSYDFFVGLSAKKCRILGDIYELENFRDGLKVKRISEKKEQS